MYKRVGYRIGSLLGAEEGSDAVTESFWDAQNGYLWGNQEVNLCGSRRRSLRRPNMDVEQKRTLLLPKRDPSGYENRITFAYPRRIPLGMFLGSE